MILVQQPSLLPAAAQLQKPLSGKSNVTGKKIDSTYLPILNSYPRIAPHPSKKPPDKFLSNNQPQNPSKRMCTEYKRDDTPVTRSLPEQHLSKKPKLSVLTSGLPCSSSTRDARSSSGPTTVSSSQGSPSGSIRNTIASIIATRGLHRDSTTSTHHRRFLSTIKILKQSGLLDITLRTKKLLRQSNATERSIAQLRQHTELLCRAASNPTCSPRGTTAWEDVYRAMAESGRYPNLKMLHTLLIPCHPDSASQPASISTGVSSGPPASESSKVPSSRLLAILLESNTEQDSELEAVDKSSEKVTFTPPDSSTG